MATIFRIAIAAGALLGSASAVMAQDVTMSANTFGNGVPQYVEFCAPQFGELRGQPYGPYSLPPSVIMRNPEVPAFAWEGKHSSGRVSGEIICVP
jgi:hypothetical protein